MDPHEIEVIIEVLDADDYAEQVEELLMEGYRECLYTCADCHYSATCLVAPEYIMQCLRCHSERCWVSML
jgi:hypothetical protein